jgi:hypothetical protein
MRFTRFLAAALLAPLLIATAWSAPRHATSKPVVRHSVARKAATPPGNTHYKHGQPVATPGTRKHKWL